MRPGTPSSSRLAALLLALLSLRVLGHAQTQAPPASPPSASPPAVFKSTSALVLVDVIVTNPQGPVHGIPRSQFHLLEDGKEQKLIALEVHDAPDPAKVPKPLQLPPNIYGNTADGFDGAVNVLLLDALNTPMADQSYVRQQMISYLKTIRPGTHLAIFTLASRLRIVQGFTSDSRPLLAALHGKSALPNQSALLADPYDTTNSDVEDALPQMGATADAMASIQQFQADQAAFQMDLRVRYTLDALQQLARYLGGVPGRKNLIWFSGSFPISLDPDATLQSPFEAMRNYAPDVTETTRMLSASRVAVYPVDARGLLIDPQFSAQASGSGMAGNSSGSSMGSSGGSRRGARGALGGGGSGGGIGQPKFASNSQKFTQQTIAEHATMQQIAEETGGIAFLDRNDLQNAVDQAIQNGASYYTLAYIPETKPDDDRFHKIQVSIPEAPSYHLAYRHGYVAVSAKKQAPNTGTLSMAAAMLRGAPSSSELIFKVRVLPASDPLFKALPTSAGTVGDLSPNVKGPLQRYCLDYAADLHAAALSETTDGIHHAAIEFVAVAYDRDGARLNAIDRAYTVNLTGDKYAQVMQKGLQIHQEIDLPAGEVYLRAAVHDLNSDRIGALEVPLSIKPPAAKP